MNCARRLFNFLLERETRVVEPTLIDKINSAVRANGPGHRGNCVDNELQAFVAVPQRLRGPRALSKSRSVPLRRARCRHADIQGPGVIIQANSFWRSPRA